jgi:hypothetical protein
MKAALLWMFILNLGIAFGAGLYEHRIVVPTWLSPSPDGGRRWHADAVRRDDTSRRLWVRRPSRLVAGRRPCGVGRPRVDLLVLHSDDDRADERG